MSLSPLDLFRLTSSSLRGNPLRTCLTTLGVFMGVAAVNATLQVKNISTAVIERQLAQQEAPQIRIYLWAEDGRSLRSQDMKFLKQQLPDIQAVSGAAFFTCDNAIYQNQEAEICISAVSQNRLLTSGRKIVEGRFFNLADFENYRAVAVVDRLFAEELDLGENPINRRVYVAGKAYTIVGLMETKLVASGQDKPRGAMLVSLALYEAMTGQKSLDGIQIRPKKIEDLERLGEQAEQLLLQRFPGGEVYAWNNAEEIVRQQQTLGMAARGLLAVGAIALLVAGVGIANITIASVMERTAEIGLRRAIGATQRDIMMQFILEAALMSLVGGTSAIAAVDGLTRVVANQFELPYNFEVSTAGVSLGAALLVGIGSSFLPATRASQLEPVKALRSN